MSLAFLDTPDTSNAQWVWIVVDFQYNNAVLLITTDKDKAEKCYASAIGERVEEYVVGGRSPQEAAAQAEDDISMGSCPLDVRGFYTKAN